MEQSKTGTATTLRRLRTSKSPRLWPSCAVMAVRCRPDDRHETDDINGTDYTSSLLFDAVAQRKSCEDLKSEIATKLDAKGVKNYQLKIVAPDEIKGESVVGSCDAGAKRIT
jgi:Protein of unknown function (DUF1161)